MHFFLSFALQKVQVLLLLSYSLNLEKVKPPAISVFFTIQPSYDILQEKTNAEIYFQTLNTEERKVFEIVLPAD